MREEVLLFAAEDLQPPDSPLAARAEHGRIEKAWSWDVTAWPTVGISRSA